MKHAHIAVQTKDGLYHLKLSPRLIDTRGYKTIKALIAAFTPPKE